MARDDHGRRRGRVVLLVAVLSGALLAGAAWWWLRPVVLAPPGDLAAEDRDACEAFVAALPSTLDDAGPRATTPDDALGAAYGRPAMTVTCGVAVPEEFDFTSECVEANGIGWWAPAAQYENQDADVTIYAVSYEPLVELVVPGGRRPAGLASALAELSEAVSGSLRQVRDCI